MAMRLELATFCFCSGYELGEAVRPALRDPVRGGGVDDDGVGIGAHRDCLDRRVVGEAEDGGVRGVEKLGALGGILAIVAGERDDLDIVAAGEPVADLEAGRARLAVDEDLFRRHRIDADDAGPGRRRGSPARLESRAGRAQDRGCAEGECGHDELAGLDRRVPVGVRGGPFQQHVFRDLLRKSVAHFRGRKSGSGGPPPHPGAGAAPRRFRSHRPRNARCSARASTSTSADPGGMVTRDEIAAAAKKRGLAMETTTFGPFFKITARRLSTRAGEEGRPGTEDADVIGEHDGFIAPPPFGILHMDSMRIYNSRVRGDDEKSTMRSTFGLSILLGATSSLMAHEAGCRKVELLSIDDGNEYAPKLVKYYGRLGFKTVKEVGDNGFFEDLPHLLVWGGVRHQDGRGPSAAAEQVGRHHPQAGSGTVGNLGRSA